VGVSINTIVLILYANGVLADEEGSQHQAGHCWRIAGSAANARDGSSARRHGWRNRIILLGIETDRAMVAALDDVPRYTRNREAGATWHEEFSVTDRLHISRKTWSVPYYYRRHEAGLLNYSRHRISNACAEGFNSAIQLIMANARGFRNFTNYRARVLFHCGKLDMSLG